MKKKLLSIVLTLAMIMSLFAGMGITAGAAGATIQAFTGVDLNGTTVTLTLDSSKTYRVHVKGIGDYIDDLTSYQNDADAANAMVGQPVLTSSEEIENNWWYSNVKTFANMSTYNSKDVTLTGKSSYTIEIDERTLIRVFEVDPDISWNNGAGSTLRPVLAAYGAILIPVYPDIESVGFTTNWPAMPTMKDGGDFPFMMTMGFMPPVLSDNQKVFADPYMSVKVTADNIQNVVNSDFLELIDSQGNMSNADLLAAYKAFVTEEGYTAYPDWVNAFVMYWPDSGDPIPAINPEYKVNTTDEYALLICAMTDKNNFSENLGVTFDDKAVTNVYRYTDGDTCVCIAFVHELGKLSAFEDKLPERYEITWVEESEGGEVSVYPDNGMAAEGETVYISTWSNTGYTLESIKVYKTGDTSTVVAVQMQGNGGQFTMPAYAVTVDVAFDGPYVITLDDSDLENAGACVRFYPADDDDFRYSRSGMLTSTNKTLSLEDNTDKAEVWVSPVSEDYAFDPNNLPVVTVTTGNTTVTLTANTSMGECYYIIPEFTGDSTIKVVGAAVAPDTPPVGGGTPELGSITIDAYYSEIFGKIEDGKTLPDLDSLLDMGTISAEVQDKGYNLIRIYAVDAKWYRASKADNYATIVEVEYDEVADTENNLYLIEVIVVSDPYLVDPDTFGLTSDGIHSGRDIYVNTNTSGWDYAIYEHQFFSLQTLEERNYFTVKFIPVVQDPDIPDGPDGPVESDGVVVELGEDWITRSGNTVTINVPNGENYMLGVIKHAEDEWDNAGYCEEVFASFIGKTTLTPENFEDQTYNYYNECYVEFDNSGYFRELFTYAGIDKLITSNGTPIVLNITEDQSIFLFHVGSDPIFQAMGGYKVYAILGVHAEAYLYDANLPTTHEHSYTYIANNNGTHNGACECGEDAIVNEGCTYVDGRCEKCGYSKPTAPSVHKHSFVYTPNSNNTHDGVCVCKQVSIFNQACTFVNGKCEKCGYSEPVDISVSNGENTVDAEAEVSGNDAIIKPLDVEQIEQLVGGENNSGDIVIDLTDLDKNIDTAGIPKSTLEAIVEAAEDTGNNTEHLIIKLSTAELKLDDTAMRAIVEQANGDIIKFNFDDVGLGRLNEAQKESVKDMDVRKGYEAYITVNDQRIGDFKGGNVEIIVPYEVPEGENIASFSVWYIDDDGTLEKQKSTYNGKEKCFVVTHFSDYIIVYSASDNFDNINSDSNSISDIESGCGRVICTIWIIVIILICVAVYFILKKRIQDKIKAEKVKH